ncbi:MAG: 4-hydroxybutyrate--acetyl-CoA CoA transferase [Tissierellia bacterium]|nr:4-hydroxybutyrate--acetyl-CoA CoA transferase [Tissierellia bacterium]
MVDYKDKVITAEEAVKLVKSDMHIVTGLGGSEAREFFKFLHTRAEEVDNVTVTTYLPQGKYEYMNEEYKGKFHVDSLFYTGVNRTLEGYGMSSYIPNNLSAAGRDRLSHLKPSIYVGAAARPDKHGNISLSLGNVFERRNLEAADIVILEVSSKYPRIFGDHVVPLSAVDYLIEVDYNPPLVPDGTPNEKDEKIGELIAEMIPDGACIQIGIGGVPDAVAGLLMEKKNLGVHTEMLTSGLGKLARAGVINGTQKQIDKGVIVTAFILGNQELYDFIDDNPVVQVRDAAYANDPNIISKNDNQISVNTALEVDLSGQVSSESIGSRQFSGTGGQADTHRGAYMSKGGKAIITLYSTAMVKNKETGEKEEKSKIVPRLMPGAYVTLQRQDVDMIVTEYGVAKLKGTNMVERVERLIAIAHPKFRDELRKDAIKFGLIKE